MNYLSKIFSQEPFDYLKMHMGRVLECIAELEDILPKVGKGSLEDFENASVKITKIENDADLIKNKIRISLPKRFLFPVDRNNFLELLTLQDNLADCAEDIGAILSIKPLSVEESLHDFDEYYKKSIEAVKCVGKVVLEFGSLLESSFGGLPAERAKLMIEDITKQDHEIYLVKKKLIKNLFGRDKVSPPDFYLWTQLIKEIGNLPHYSEKLALRIGILLN